MKIIEAINRVNLLKPNTYSQSEKVRWLSALDGIVKTEIIDKHEGGEDITFVEYDDTTPTTTDLLVPAPYDDIYLFWLEAKIDYWNGEYGKYNNSISMYNTAIANYEKHYNSTHLPKGNHQFHF